MKSRRLVYNAWVSITIHPAQASDLPAYTDLLQQTYESTYVDTSLGLTKEQFSKEIFNTPDTQKYLKNNLLNDSKQLCLLACDGDLLVGSITLEEREHDYELRGFYVLPDYQGQGIGTRLWHEALEKIKKKDITCDIYGHNKKALSMYQKWGFVIDTKRGTFTRHWPEWPENVKVPGFYLRYER